MTDCDAAIPQPGIAILNSSRRQVADDPKIESNGRGRFKPDARKPQLTSFRTFERYFSVSEFQISQAVAYDQLAQWGACIVDTRNVVGSTSPGKALIVKA